MSEQASSSSSGAQKSNRLSLEKSPYLLQHAFNPVNWYPWGDEAFEKAKKEKKLIFLSVGYSTCHWCHVMEKESFENAAVAEVMNKNFICVKVDREERPDVDKMYMAFVQRTTGSGGWPMSVFLTPDLEPLFGGTYFPPEDRYGRVGFKSILTLIAKQWSEQHAILDSEAKSSVSSLKRMSTFKFATDANTTIPGAEAARKCLLQFSKSYEKEFGGFSTAPKFPQPSIFEFMFYMYSKERDSEAGRACLNMSLHTLRRMAYGGIHDHVNTGFARYSVDGKWHVPHFEKMLYDQGQLVVVYTDAYVITKDDFFADIIKDILNYVSRDLSHELGGFYGAEDADSYPCEGAPHKKEGAFCVWEFNEINNMLDEQVGSVSLAELFCYHYSVKKNGNVGPGNDPHGELRNKNVLTVFGTYEDTADKFNITIPQLKEILGKGHKILYDERQKRPKPHVDTKIVTSWNGLMISGFAKAGFALNEQKYVDRAVLAANFIKKHLYNPKTKTLLRCCYRGEDNGITQTGNPINGFVDDYAFLIRGLLDLYEATLDSSWLEWVETLQDTQDRLFWDSKHSGYFTSPEGDPSILIRDKEGKKFVFKSLS
ncbi:spermatogenesis-associated protein 20 [Holotrichia oblita]|uniref:Spermatogenesis-associated protein 20 n=1 Tax=Holotrichia oblita TaxID=644536 RepID=A0ACB9STV7_HOLOL|nr:spermatogenesis-associated protein 20 [Holotrichia oblita]